MPVACTRLGSARLARRTSGRRLLAAPLEEHALPDGEVVGVRLAADHARAHAADRRAAARRAHASVGATPALEGAGAMAAARAVAVPPPPQPSAERRGLRRDRARRGDGGADAAEAARLERRGEVSHRRLRRGQERQPGRAEQRDGEGAGPWRGGERRRADGAGGRAPRGAPRLRGVGRVGEHRREARDGWRREAGGVVAAVGRGECWEGQGERGRR
mmetsp:Transcript_27451/g.68236  ORF Transcript_27451/g.68236 Transcript_27451/m.68236 type:complete len:217 (-) Transcript_27451:124-774(-)